MVRMIRAAQTRRVGVLVREVRENVREDFEQPRARQEPPGFHLNIQFSAMREPKVRVFAFLRHSQVG